MAKARASKRKVPVRKRSAGGSRPRFVGRDPSPVLDRYPPKDPALSVRGPPTPVPPGAAPVPPAAAVPVPPATAPTPPAPGPLIRLDSPFDLDDFSSLLGETSIRVTVPREDLPEVLRRVTEFMGFGIYVYAIEVRPAPTELLKAFVVELRRVDYSAERKAWIAFEEKGTAGSPFGPSGTRT
ncbi:MAG TPA: hypothetical protein VMG99_02120 [Thermoplasmata archaeon]|jgi:hypothetical protein|nr:hypothetical protein [Thermoplasmata archaeon]